MFTLDERIKGIPAGREQVASLHESINQPHLAIPGKQAGPAQAFIAGLRIAGGYAVFVYLFLSQANDCAVYVSERKTVSSEEFANEEADAVAFVESMGFMVDNLNFRSLPPERQDELLKSLPVFQRTPTKPGGGGKAAEAGQKPTAVVLGRLFSSF